MSKKLIAVGSKLLVLPKETETFKTESGLVVADSELGEFEIVEVGSDVKDVYSVGDTILCPKAAGVSQFYNHKPYLWVNGQSASIGGDVWAIVK